ncbi:MAG: SoxR reducing system RseC family protein [Gammaproteobacteria bacterium]|nr:SoxR reducing system RseC family protein [Gammaproteobacteria bacterium]MDH5730881.1 SoxR reducing system RseC family protein [Gammaproteobacteria bacterium]
MIEETATVVKVEEAHVWVQAQRKTACEACNTKSCGVASVSAAFPKKQVAMRLSNSLNLQLGDRVLLGLQAKALVQASLFVYGLPLVALILGLVIGSLFANMMGLIYSESMQTIFGLGGLIVSIMWLVGKRKKTVLENTCVPEIIRKI